MKKQFDNEIFKAINDYGDDCIDIAIDKGTVYGFYHSKHDSFPVTNNYNLNNLGGIEVLKALEKEYNGLVAICHME